MESRVGSIPPPAVEMYLCSHRLKINDPSQTSPPAALPRLETLLTASEG